MPWIQNVAFIDVIHGHHIPPGPNAMLIQIIDVEFESFPTPLYEFKRVYQFRFDDDDNVPKEPAIEILDLLIEAKKQHMNVIVHCVAGLCRSGAVAEVGSALGFLGFIDGERRKIPNVALKNHMMRELRRRSGRLYYERMARLRIR